MERPKAISEDYRVLRVVALSPFGAFLDWGQDKDLLLPTSEQVEKLSEGDEIIVAISEDEQGRPFASMRLESFIPHHVDDLKVDQQVKLLIYRRTDIGYKAIIENKAIGVLYGDQVFKPLFYGQVIDGYIQKIRTDGKIDLSLSRTGHQAAIGIEPEIIKLLQEQGGFLALNEKTSPETIYKLFGVSKKKYKIVLGGLYKRKLITIHDDGIRLVPNSTSTK
ncbi:MAG: hypothetical protein A2622_12565 [Bdellovibrionales bacterium RIFCSPHIGHO2_01_FULL_40_29]|nr:MAG: hypothetical protein A2622_12565 [Bdellovibrionales bacterium RIFCSPHIGHO2_01_FULL_40_29]OFZ33014.1 MAG: hypothetical protein A3D17_09870 [Bdellovibrionales bacterium RIFCSPHIGHO2_02_FULL_40_15]